jgi:hypothetical protein
MVVAGAAMPVLGLGAGVANASVSTVAMWHMDETSGSTMNDSSGHGNNGTLTNISLGQSGLKGNAYSFNGSSSKVTVPNSSNLNPGTSALTLTVNIKFSVKPSGSVGDYDIIRKGLSSDPGDYKLEILGTGKASCHWKGTSGSTPDTMAGGPDLSDNQWHKVVCKRKGGNKEQLIIDGTVEWTQSVNLGSISNSAVLTLGAKTSGSGCCDWYKGLMDEVSVKVG